MTPEEIAALQEVAMFWGLVGISLLGKPLIATTLGTFTRYYDIDEGSFDLEGAGIAVAVNSLLSLLNLLPIFGDIIEEIILNFIDSTRDSFANPCEETG